MTTDRPRSDDDPPQDTAELGGSDGAPGTTWVPERRAPSRPASRSERLDLLEAEVTVLLTMGRIHTEALTELTEALQRAPDEEPGDAAEKVSRGARRAHALLLSLRDVPR